MDHKHIVIKELHCIALNEDPVSIFIASMGQFHEVSYGSGT